MMKRSVSFAAAFAALLSFNGRADAGFTYSTSITSVTVTNGSVTSPVSPANFTVAGANFSLNDQTMAASILAVPNESIVSSGTTNGVGAFTFVEQIKITDSSGATGIFTETASYVVAGGVYAQSGVPILSSPTTEVIGSATYTISNPGASGSTIGNNLSNGSVSAVILATAVPEPSSIAMLGMGAIGIGGLMSRSRRPAG